MKLRVFTTVDAMLIEKRAYIPKAGKDWMDSMWERPVAPSEYLDPPPTYRCPMCLKLMGEFRTCPCGFSRDG